MSGFKLDDYVDVATRITRFYEKYPDGSFETDIVELTETRVIVRARAYRNPEDVRPSVAHSQLGIPGSTNYTRGSEVENAETSAVGRAIAFLGFEVKKGIASREEVRNKQGGEVRADVERSDDGSLIGTLEVGDKASSDMQLRNTPEGPVIGFRLRGQRGGILVRCRGALAVELHAFKEAAIGQRVTCWGRVTEETFTPRGKTEEVRYQVLDAERIRLPEVGDIPAAADTAEVSTGLTEAESEAIWDGLQAVAGA